MEQFITLAARARGGDDQAMEQLLRLSHTPVLYQARVILQNEQAAQRVTRDILTHIFKEPYALENPRHFELWLNRVTARRCIHTLSQLPKAPPAPRQAPPPLTGFSARRKPSESFRPSWTSCPTGPGPVWCCTAAAA